MEWIWIIAGIAGLSAVAVGLFRFFGAFRPAADLGELPVTPLEQLGQVGLVVTGLLGVGLVSLVAVRGVAAFARDGATRGIFTIMVFAGVGVWAYAWRRLSRPTGSTVIDERDRDIQARSFTVESVMVILSLVAWTVALTEAFWDEGAVPLGYLQLVFWSTFIVGAFGRALGIVLGYRREP